MFTSINIYTPVAATMIIDVDSNLWGHATYRKVKWPTMSVATPLISGPKNIVIGFTVSACRYIAFYIMSSRFILATYHRLPPPDDLIHNILYSQHLTPFIIRPAIATVQIGYNLNAYCVCVYE